MAYGFGIRVLTKFKPSLPCINGWDSVKPPSETILSGINLKPSHTLQNLTAISLYGRYELDLRRFQPAETPQYGKAAEQQGKTKPCFEFRG